MSQSEEIAHVSVGEAIAIAREAYIYAFAMMESYNTWYPQTVVKNSPGYVGGFNCFRHYAQTFTPANRDIVTPNNDTPYSWAWLDLRAEPMVISVPAVASDRYYVLQFIDLFTYNCAYIGSRSTGNTAGDYLMAGPQWQGEVPSAIRKVFHSETEIVGILGRTQLNDEQDVGQVRLVQAGYKITPLSAYLKRPAPPQPAPLKFPPYDKAKAATHDFILYLNFLLQFIPHAHPRENALRKRMEKIGIAPGAQWNADRVDATILAAIDKGVADAQADIKHKISVTHSSNGLFGSRDVLGEDYLTRDVAAAMGLYGNDLAEAWYGGFVGDGNQLQQLYFSRAQLPPARFFWSITLYTLPDRFLYDNPLNRYSIGDRTAGLQYDDAGGLMLYVGHASPGEQFESNWLPAPQGIYSFVARVYGPSQAAMSGEWKLPKPAPLNPLTKGTTMSNAPSADAATSAPVYVSNSSDSLISGQSYTPIGTITLEKGLPASPEDSRALYDELDFQRACQTYLWALPIVSFAQWQHQHEEVFGAQDGQLVIYENYRDKLGILTANATTPYIMAFANLRRTGPLVIDFPAGPMAGGVGDFWQRSVTDMGETGPDQGRGAKYLLVGKGDKVPAAEGYRIVQMPMNNIMFGVRSLEPDPQKSKALVAELAIYPFSKKDLPTKTAMLFPAGKPWNQGQPRGLDYWERLHAILQEEQVEERDRMMMAMLAPLGIEKGKPFSPDKRQREILQQGADVGELMAMNFSFNKRFEGARYRKDTNWVYVLELKDPNQEDVNYTQLDQRTAWFYEAVTASKGMMSRSSGAGQAYLGAYHDKDGNWFDGAKTYRLRVPPDAPARQFWSLTVYDTRTRCLIDNEEEIADKSSRMSELVKNEDGSVDLYIGPVMISGFKANWIPSIPDRAWFAYFRLYGPLDAYLDSSWPLPDIELVKELQ